MVPGIVLAAGRSSRMGSPKALLAAPDGRPFVVCSVSALHGGGVDQVVVVTGQHHDEIAAALAAARLVDVRLVRNPDPDRGQLSSLWAGLDEVNGMRPEAAAVTLVDVPMVQDTTVRAVLDRWRTTRAAIVRPRFRGRRGHPVIFDRAVFDDLRRAPLAEGARVVVRARMQESVDVDVDDPGCIRDVDTPDEYRALLTPPSA